VSIQATKAGELGGCCCRLLSVGYELKESKESGWSRPLPLTGAPSAFIGQWAGGQPENSVKGIVTFWSFHQKLSYRGKAAGLGTGGLKPS
jgi:hypothetical protein